MGGFPSRVRPIGSAGDSSWFTAGAYQSRPRPGELPGDASGRARHAARYPARSGTGSVPLVLHIDPSIQTDRLWFRPYLASDRATVLDLFGRADVTRYLPFGPATETTVDAILERRMARTTIEHEGDGILALAVLRATDMPVGEMMLRYESQEHRTGEVGWTIHPDHQGQGLATEGAGAFLRLGFERLDLHRITANCDPRNAASIRVMERLGMRREAHLHEAFLSQGGWTDELIYAILRAEWEATAGDRAR